MVFLQVSAGMLLGGQAFHSCIGKAGNKQTLEIAFCAILNKIDAALLSRLTVFFCTVLGGIYLIR
jgi:hypothetical protein